MGVIHQQRVRDYFHRGSTAATAVEQGRALEDLVCYLFEAVPGVEVTERNVVNAFNTEEIDVAFWNNQPRRGLWFLPTSLLIECKNWSRPVSGVEVTYFVRRLQSRALKLGILVSTYGVTGSPIELTDAHFEIATALKDDVRIIVIDRDEIERLTHSNDLVLLVKRKLTMLAARGTCF